MYSHFSPRLSDSTGHRCEPKASQRCESNPRIKSSQHTEEGAAREARLATARKEPRGLEGKRHLGVPVFPQSIETVISGRSDPGQA